jgi:hypothetical protein
LAEARKPYGKAGAGPDHREGAEAGSIAAPFVAAFVVVHGAAHARQAMAAAATHARAVRLLSAPGAAAYGGAAWFLACCAEAGGEALAVLDCGPEPGRVLQAMRVGLPAVVFTGTPAMSDTLAGIGRQAGCTLLRARPPALDMAALDLDEPGAAQRLEAFLMGPGG